MCEKIKQPHSIVIPLEQGLRQMPIFLFLENFVILRQQIVRNSKILINFASLLLTIWIDDAQLD